MDVRCEKCQTVYEFDDARVKESGVTVKCTQCGHIFRVMKRAAGARPRTLPGMPAISDNPTTVEPQPGAQAASASVPATSEPSGVGDARLWLLRSATSGEIRRFRDLTTLQQWIVEKRAFREDEISRNGDRWKRIGGSVELEPFFRVIDDAERARSAVDSATAQTLAVGGAPEPPAIGPMSAMRGSPAGSISAAQGPTLVQPPGGFRAASPVPSTAITPIPSSQPTLVGEARLGQFAPSEGPALSDPFLDRIPRRGPGAGSLLAVAAVLLLVGGAGYVVAFKRQALQSLLGGDEGGRGHDAWRKGREYFLLDTDEDFRRADQQLQRAQGADEANPQPVAALVELNATWAQWLREDARIAERMKPGTGAAPKQEAQVHLDEARRYAGEARSLGADDPDVHRATAYYLVLDGAPAAQVEEHLRKAEAKRADDAELAFVRGALAQRDGRFDEARAALERANKLNQQKTQHDLLRADYLLALLAAGTDRVDEARTAARRISTENPRHARATALQAALDDPTRRGALRFQPVEPAAATAAADPGQAAGAAAAPAAAQGSAPASPAAVPAAAIAAPTGAIPVPSTATPTTPAAVAAQAPAAPTTPTGTATGAPATPVATADTGKPPAAPAAAAPVKVEPKGYYALVEAGDKLMERGKARDAQRLYERALLERPDGVEARNGLAYALLDTEHFNAAADEFRRVLSIVPGNGDALIGLAETYKVRGDRAHAVEQYEKYLAGSPHGSKSEMARRNLQELKAELAQKTRPPAATSDEVHDAPPLPPPPPP